MFVQLVDSRFTWFLRDLGASETSEPRMNQNQTKNRINSSSPTGQLKTSNHICGTLTCFFFLSFFYCLSSLILMQTARHGSAFDLWSCSESVRGRGQAASLSEQIVEGDVPLSAPYLGCGL